jgi:hypothetical protein
MVEALKVRVEIASPNRQMIIDANRLMIPERLPRVEHKEVGQAQNYILAVGYLGNEAVT